MASESGQTRRRYGSQFNAKVLAQCEEPDMSVAKVAMSHGINDNVCTAGGSWRGSSGPGLPPTVTAPRSAESAAGFVLWALPAPATPDVKTEIRLEIRRGAVTVGIAWPEQAPGDLAGFVRELLK